MFANNSIKTYIKRTRNSHVAFKAYRNKGEARDRDEHAFDEMLQVADMRAQYPDTLVDQIEQANWQTDQDYENVDNAQVYEEEVCERA